MTGDPVLPGLLNENESVTQSPIATPMYSGKETIEMIANVNLFNAQYP